MIPIAGEGVGGVYGRVEIFLQWEAGFTIYEGTIAKRYNLNHSYYYVIINGVKGGFYKMCNI
jgi:hypothetical protein